MPNDRIDEILHRLERLEEMVGGDLIKVTRLADQLDVCPRTIRRRCRKQGIYLHTMYGDKWEPGRDRGEPQYVHRRAWKRREAVNGPANSN